MFILETHNQEIHFQNGSKCCADRIIDVREGNMIHLLLEDGREYIINKDHVDYTICTPCKNFEKVVL